MSLMKLDHILDRIKGAPKDSPIAVFSGMAGSGELNAVFADTIQTQQLIAKNHPSLIGVFDRHMPLGQIKQTLNQAINKQIFIRR